MTISDLSYLEVVSEVTSIVGGQKDKDAIKEEKISKKNKFQLESDNNTIVVEQSVEIVTSNEVVVVLSAYIVEE